MSCYWQTYLKIFREKCLNIYELDPGHYYTAPGFTSDCMLKYTKVELELLQDVDILMFVENSIRGEVSQCCNQYARASNKYMSDYNPEKDSNNYLMYFDVNSLYVYSMTQHLSYSEFKWLNDTDSLDISLIPDNSPIGYILEVDLEYPEHLHDLHKNMPLCPEHRTPPNSKLTKLMTTLYPKSKYSL